MEVLSLPTVQPWRGAVLAAFAGMAIVLGTASSVRAQSGPMEASSGAIHGVVFGSGSPPQLEGVVVRVDGNRVARTNADGGFVADVAPGAHTVVLEAPDGRRATVDGVEVRARATTEILVEFREGGPPSIDVEAPSADASEDRGDRAVEQPSEAADAEPGLLRGTVRSREDGKPVQGARVLVRGVDRGAKTGAEGTFELELPPGRFDVSVVHSKYSTASREDVRIESGEPASLTLELAPAAVRMSAHTVTIPKIEGGTVNMVEQKRDSSAATEVIGAEQFAKSGDSTAAGALKRVTGLTVIGGKYVYVRGMGSRYSSSLLNGATLPSPEPNKRVVPLDMFPTSILEKVTVQKTYTPDLPANFGGGAVKMTTRSYPDEFEAGLSLSTGGATDTTFREGLTYDGGATDWLGVGDGSRKLPEEVRNETAGKALTKKDRFGRGNFTAEELESIGEALPNNWNTRRRTLPPNLGVGFELGDSWDLGGATAGFRLAGKYDYGHDTDRYTETTFVQSGEGLKENNSYEFLETNDEVVTSAILTGGVEFDDDNRLKLTSTLNRVTDDHTRRYEGHYSDYGGDIRVTRLQWIERQLMFHQLEGTHTFSKAGDLEVEWSYVYSQARRREPDRRQYRYDFAQSIDAYALSDRPEGNSRLWSRLVDNNHDASVSARLPFDVWNDLEASAEVGLAARRKDRNVHTRRFKFANKKTNLEVFRRRPEGIFTDANIGPDSFFEITDVTRATDNYTGGQTVLAGYAMAELPIVESLRVNGGFRVEHSRQRVETFALFSDQRDVGRLVTTDVLPALNATWEFGDEMQLRAGASRTVNRPNLRELSSARYTDVVGGREFQGNPDLNRARLTHFDTRWEWYPERGESLSVGAFYKDFQDPIEMTFEAGATPVVRPANVQGARNFGVEFQGRTNFDFVSNALRDLYVSGNVSLIDSRVRIDPDSKKADILTTTERPLQGQSPYVLNAQISWDDADAGTTATLLYNVYGPRVTEVGIYGIPNVVEKPFHTVDLTVSRDLAAGFELSAEAGNLLNMPRRYTQGDRVTHVESEGRSFSVGISWSP